MWFQEIFASEQSRKAAGRMAADALAKHGDQAVSVLRIKARLTHSPERRVVYKLAARAAKRMQA